MLFVVVMIGGGFLLVRFTLNRASVALNTAAGWVNMADGLSELWNIDDLIAEHEAQGYSKHMQQVAAVSETVNDKRLYIC